MSRCGLIDLDGISSTSSLVVCYLTSLIPLFVPSFTLSCLHSFVWTSFLPSFIDPWFLPFSLPLILPSICQLSFIFSFINLFIHSTNYSSIHQQELYVAFNDISDVSPVSMLDNLQVLDLEGNLIDDLSQVEFLTLCSSLKSLNLEGNPVCVAPHPSSTADVSMIRMWVIPHAWTLHLERIYSR